jgi:hypothetical protein
LIKTVAPPDPLGSPAPGRPLTETRRFRGHQDDAGVLHEVRETVRQAVEALIRKLQAIRERDPKRGLLDSLLPKGQHRR